MEKVSLFLKSLLMNKSINLGANVNEIYREIVIMIARMYYMTENMNLKQNAMELLKYVNGSERYSYLLDNVQHPANQNIYMQDKKVENKNLNEKGLKSSQLTNKLI